MNFLFDFVHDYPLISLAQGAFTLWMAVDAYRRGAEFFWYWIIFFVPFIGPWVYFFAVLAPNLGNMSWPVFQRRVSMEELQYRADQAPTLANNLALAQALIARREYTDAIPYLEAAHKIEPEHGQVLYGLAVCHARLDRLPEALAFLERNIKKDPRWSDFQAWILLIEIHRQVPNLPVALEETRDLVRQSPTLCHKCLLAEILIDLDQIEEARALLDRALVDHNYAPGPARRRNRRWAGQARKLLKSIG